MDYLRTLNRSQWLSIVIVALLSGTVAFFDGLRPLGLPTCCTCPALPQTPESLSITYFIESKIVDTTLVHRHIAGTVIYPVM